MGFHEGQKKVLAFTDNNHYVVAGCADRTWPGERDSSFYLYIVLG